MVVREDGLIPVSLAQRYVIELGKVSGGNILISGFFRIKGKLDVGRFQKAVDLVYEQSDTLRMQPVIIDGEYYVKDRKDYRTKVLFEDFSSTKDNEEIYEDVKKKVLEEMKENVCFENGSELTRMKLYKISDDDFCFRSSVHHALFDGVAGGILFMKVMQAYKNPEIKFSEGKTHAEYIQEMNEFYTTDEGKESIEFLKEELCKNYAIPMVNAKKDLDLNLDYNLLSIGDLIFSKKEMIPIIKKYKASPFIITMFAYQLVIAKTLGLDDVFVLFADDNRTDLAVKQTLGMIALTIGVRLKIDDHQISLGDMFAKYRGEFIRNEKNPLYPVLTSGLFANPFAVTYQAVAKKLPDIDENLKLEYIELENENRKYGNLFPLFGFEDNDKVIIRFAFDTSLYPKEFAMEFKAGMKKIIDELANNDSNKVSELQVKDCSDFFDIKFMQLL